MFFEMFGNFSFGDYFKCEVIYWVWWFFMDKFWLGVDFECLYVIVYLDDDEVVNIWYSEVGLLMDCICCMDEDDNFWFVGVFSNGLDGVCGFCSEIFYMFDDGSDFEIWNFVFM